MSSNNRGDILNLKEQGLVERNFGIIFGVSFKAYRNFITGINKQITDNKRRLKQQLDQFHSEMERVKGEKTKAQRLILAYSSAITVQEKEAALTELKQFSDEAVSYTKLFSEDSQYNESPFERAFINDITKKHTALEEASAKKEEVNNRLIAKLTAYVQDDSKNASKKRVMKTLLDYLENPSEATFIAIDTAIRNPENAGWDSGIFSNTTTSSYRKIMEMHRSSESDRSQDEGLQFDSDPEQSHQNR